MNDRKNSPSLASPCSAGKQLSEENNDRGKE